MDHGKGLILTSPNPDKFDNDEMVKVMEDLHPIGPSLTSGNLVLRPKTSPDSWVYSNAMPIG